MKNLMKVALLVMAMCLLLTGCQDLPTINVPFENPFDLPFDIPILHHHVWRDATCTTPKSCACGETIGEALGHKGGLATCTAKAICATCNQPFGELKDHVANEDDNDCTTAVTCKNCSYIFVPGAASHTGGTATCTEKAVCSTCETAYGEFAEHVYDAETHLCVCEKADPDYYFPVTIPEALAAKDGYQVEVSGTVCVAEAWNSQFNNMSVTIIDAQGNKLYVYRLGTKVELGDIITVKGKMATYNDARQIAQGATAVVTGHDTSYDVVPEYTLTDALEAADGTNVKVTGTVVKINYAWSSSYGNMSITIADENGNTLYIYKLASEVALNDVITVTGSMATYNDARQIAAGATAEKVGTHTCANYSDATCEAPAACVVCGAAKDDVLGDHNYVDGACSVCGEAEVTGPKTMPTTTYTFANPAGTGAYGETEPQTYTFADGTTMTISGKGRYTATQLQLYPSATVVFKFPGLVNKITYTTSGSGKMDIWVSENGSDWTNIGTYGKGTVTVDLKASYQYVKTVNTHDNSQTKPTELVVNPA